MEQSIGILLLIQAVLIGLNAMFACAETAIVSMNDAKLAKLAEEGDPRAARLARLTSEPSRFLATVRVAITLSGFLGSAFAAENFADMLVEFVVKTGLPVPVKVLDFLAVVLITIVLSYFTMVFGELVPKHVASRRSEEIALGMSGLISLISRIFSPMVSFLTLSANAVLRLYGIDPNALDDEVSEEEIRMMVDVGEEIGTIDSDEKEIIQNVFEFDDICAEDIVTRRSDVIMLDIEESMENWKEIIFSTRHTRYPICEGSADKIIGILNAKEYFRLSDLSRESVMENAVREPYFVPNMIRADVLFANMKKKHQTLAVVLDEYGGMTGIVTLNDLVEQIVGNLGEEDGLDEEELIRQVGKMMWKIQGGAALEDVSKAIGVKLFCDNYSTFNGYIFETTGKIPKDGETFELKNPALHIRIIDMQKHQAVTIVTRQKEMTVSEAEKTKVEQQK